MLTLFYILDMAKAKFDTTNDGGWVLNGEANGETFKKEYDHNVVESITEKINKMVASGEVNVIYNENGQIIDIQGNTSEILKALFIN